MQGTNLLTFIIGFATAYFAFQAYSILREKERTRLHTFLGYIFAYWTFSCMKDIVQTFPGHYDSLTLNNIFMIDGWSALTYACFLFELTMPGWVTLRRLAALCTPFALFSAVYLVHPTSAVVAVYAVFLGIFGLTILFVGYARARKYIGYIRENYSNIDGIDISWIKHVYLIAFASQLLWLVISLVKDKYLDTLYYITAIVMWQMVVSHCRGLRQVELEEDTNEQADTPAEGVRSYPFAGVMESIVEEEKLYLNPNLSLSDLTARMGTNRTYMSEYFSSVKKITFYDYINALRIERMSVPMMESHPEYTIDYIARQSGFNSLSTFRRAFRKYTGYNPGQYRSGKEGQSK